MSTPIERISPAATRSLHERIARITQDLLDAKSADARANTRLREIHNFHATDDAGLHRMLNTMQPGTYVRPHRHIDPPKDEAVVVLQGALAILTFDNNGTVNETESFRAGPGTGVWGADVRAGVWHSFMPLAPDTVVYEVKTGPFAPISDKDFASWAPAPNDPAAADYASELLARFA